MALGQRVARHRGVTSLGAASANAAEVLRP
jgi:hypothetical protein